MAEGRYEERGQSYPTERGEYRRAAPMFREEVLRVPGRVSWGSIFAGGVVALISQITLTILGVAIGAMTIDLGTEAQPFAGLGIGAAVWLALSAIISYFLGGMVAARLANIPRNGLAILHGVVTWGLAMLVLFYMAGAAASGILSGAVGLVGQGAGAAAEGAVGSESGQETLEGLEERAEEMLPQRGQLEQGARDVGQAAATGVAATAWGLFIALVLGVIAAGVGALVGKPKLVTTEPVEHPVTH